MGRERQIEQQAATVLAQADPAMDRALEPDHDADRVGRSIAARIQTHPHREARPG
jgi:hypothetical protein